MNTTFFQEIYANYNQLWQQVLKLQLGSNSLVDRNVLTFVKYYLIELWKDTKENWYSNW